MKILRIFAVAIVVVFLGVLTYYVNQGRTYNTSTLSGTFENQPTLASSRSSGRVLKIFAKEGSVVKKGDLLVQLDPGPLQADLEAQKAQLQEAKANLKKMQKGWRQEEIEAQKAVVDELRANLAKMQNGNRPQEIAQAKYQVGQAKAQLDKLKFGPRAEEIAQAKAELNSAQAVLIQSKQDYCRYKSLYESGAVSRRTFEEAEEGLRTSQASYDRASQALLQQENGYRQEDIEAATQAYQSAQEKYSLLQEGARQEDIQAAQAKLQQAEAIMRQYNNGYRVEDIEAAKSAVKAREMQVRSLAEKIAEHKVCSPIDAVVDRELVSEGDLVNAGASLLRLSNPQDIWLRVYLAQNKLALVKVGDKAVLHIDGLPGEEIEAKVTSIDTQGEYTPINLQTPEERGQQVFAIQLRLAKEDQRVKAGMAATVKSMGQWHDQLK